MKLYKAGLAKHEVKRFMNDRKAKCLQIGYHGTEAMKMWWALWWALWPWTLSLHPALTEILPFSSLGFLLRFWFSITVAFETKQLNSVAAANPANRKSMCLLDGIESDKGRFWEPAVGSQVLWCRLPAKEHVRFLCCCLEEGRQRKTMFWGSGRVAAHSPLQL